MIGRIPMQTDLSLLPSPSVFANSHILRVHIQASNGALTKKFTLANTAQTLVYHDHRPIYGILRKKAPQNASHPSHSAFFLT